MGFGRYLCGVIGIKAKRSIEERIRRGRHRMQSNKETPELVSHQFKRNPHFGEETFATVSNPTKQRPSLWCNHGLMILNGGLVKPRFPMAAMPALSKVPLAPLKITFQRSADVGPDMMKGEHDEWVRVSREDIQSCIFSEGSLH